MNPEFQIVQNGETITVEVTGPSSDDIEQHTLEGFGRSPDRFGAQADH
jgi:hypothetical protein